MFNHKTKQGELDQAAKEKAYQQSEIERTRERTEEEKAAAKKAQEARRNNSVDGMDEF